MNDDDDNYPDLDFGVDEDDQTNIISDVSSTNFLKNILNKVNDNRRSKDVSDKIFDATPASVHFGGFKIGEVNEQEVSVINISSSSSRFQILSPETEFFKVKFEKVGLLAPGMVIKIYVKFTPREYTYYYDSIRVRTPTQNLVIPIHAYPVINKVDFPPVLSFGNSPLCEPVRKEIRLRCSIPISFAYKIDILRPHPFFTVEPTRGMIPANDTLTITVTFNPITLGTCTTTLRLHVAQFGFQPMDCIVSAHALSGLLEQRELEVGKARIDAYIESVGQKILSSESATDVNVATESKVRGTNREKSDTSMKPKNRLDDGVTGKPDKRLESAFASSTSTFRSLNNKSKLPTEDSQSQSQFAKTNIRKANQKTNSDPVTSMLAATFHSPDLTGALENAIQKPHSMAQLRPLTSHDPNESAEALYGNKPIPPPQVPVPVGPGSGAAFDAGGEWLNGERKKRFLKTTVGEMNKAKHSPEKETEQVVEGLAIPKTLNSTTSVNFVLTQESGKLKPKDLKVAIAKARESREKRMFEQQTIQLQAGGTLDGALDLDGLLAEERMNLEEGNAYKRQLRELAFLSEVESVRKRESEKEFRISEEFVGIDPISVQQIERVLEQRKEVISFQQRCEWLKSISRKYTTKIPSTHATLKAGISADMAIALGIQPPPLQTNYQDPITAEDFPVGKKFAWQEKPGIPLFDPNMNDIWSKRINSMRKLVSCASKLIIHQRVKKRIKMLHWKLGQVGAVTKEEVREWVEKDNSPQAQGQRMEQLAQSQLKSKSESDSTQIPSYIKDSPQAKNSVATIICLQPDHRFRLRADMEEAAKQKAYVVSNLMSRRVLFPKYVQDESASRLQLTLDDLDDGTEVFDDRTFFALKVRPDYLSLGYTDHPWPTVPLHFPTHFEKQFRNGAHEELFLRPPAGVATAIPSQDSLVSEGEEKTTSPVIPGWMDVHDGSSAALFNGDERDFFKDRSDFRLYTPLLKRVETDIDWTLRPHSKVLRYVPSSTIRDRTPGFHSANSYLLSQQESRFLTEPMPLSGPTLVASHLPDMGRHASGFSCFRNDHLRCLEDPDPDIGPPRSKQAVEDILSDSESDDEDDNAREKPSIDLVRRILATKQTVDETVTTKSPKGAKVKAKEDKKASKAASTPNPVNASATDGTKAQTEGSAETLDLITDERKRAQVDNLLRDRKILELERMLMKNKRDIAERLANRIVPISKASKCAVQAISFQPPFSLYEDQIRRLVEPMMPKASKIFTERQPSRRQSTTGARNSKV